MDRLENGKDKLLGKIKENAGKITDSDELELKGKLQTMKSEIGDKMENVKDEVFEKTNDLLDKVKGNREDKDYKN